tara:strand:+ start:5778 stop:6398 length:621 start_codon:yes stop_codon:yes gene_type:complete
MALGIQTQSVSSGDILPIIKYDAKAGDLIRQDRTQQEDGQWVKSESEINMPFKCAFDLENTEVGWISFASGAPDFRMVKIGEPLPAKPTEEHNMGFRVRVAGKELGLREFSSTAKTVIRPLDALHDNYIAQREKNKGKVPVVEWSGTERVSTASPQGTLSFKAPVWSIVDWMPRDKFDELGAASAPENPPIVSEEPAGESDPFALD